ncbi:MAG: lysylphosphatidylglycerol synthase transmembrane domain-containing protein [Candidatus Saccharimonadales bacterium]
MRKGLSARAWMTLITLVLLGVVIFLAHREILKAWDLIGQINLWVLAILIPVQFFSYYATGGMIFNYLRSKGDLKDVSHWRMTRIALELNFVNHVLPSGGAAGFSYLGWLLSKYKVSVSRTTMAQIIRFALTFVSFVLLLMVAVGILILDHRIDRVILLLCVGLATVAIGATVGGILVIGSKKRLDAFSGWLTRLVNTIVRKITRGRKKKILNDTLLFNFFNDLHEDYMAIRRDRRILIRPFIWAVLANIADVALIWIAFWSLGFMINPALLFVAFGLASLAGGASVTPGGAGVYETIMIAFLASGHVSAEVAIAGTLIARVTLVLGTILFGYLFYQLTVNKYGKRTP